MIVFEKQIKHIGSYLIDIPKQGDARWLLSRQHRNCFVIIIIIIIIIIYKEIYVIVSLINYVVGQCELQSICAQRLSETKTDADIRLNELGYRSWICCSWRDTIFIIKLIIVNMIWLSSLLLSAPKCLLA